MATGQNGQMVACFTKLYTTSNQLLAKYSETWWINETLVYLSKAWQDSSLKSENRKTRERHEVIMGLRWKLAVLLAQIADWFIQKACAVCEDDGHWEVRCHYEKL